MSATNGITYVLFFGIKLEQQQLNQLRMKTAYKLYSVSILLCFLIFSACSHKTVPAASTAATVNNNSVGPANVDTTNMQQEILLNINQYRQSIGLPALQLLDAASAQAMRHSANMAKKLTPFGHTGLEARASAISRALGSTVSSIAENVAEGRLTGKQVVAGWLHSPGHKINIEGKYTYTGIGYAVNNGGIIYFTQIFLHP